MLAAMLAVVMLPFVYVQPVEAATGTKTVNIQVTYGQKEARALAEQINTLRKNQAQNVSGGAILTQLTYDYELEQTAMQRAAEVALVYDAQTRPNGMPVSSLYTNTNAVESISCMGSTASQVYNAWVSNQSSAEYQNMVNAACTAIGIGHVSYNGTDYWVVAYSDQLRSTNMLPECSDTVKLSIEIESTRLRDYSITGAPTGTVFMNEGSYDESHDLSKCVVTVQVEGHYPENTYCPLTDSVSVKLDNTSIVSFSGQYLYGAAVGSANVTLTCGDLTASSFSVIVQQPRIDQATIDLIANQSYTGYELRPTVRVRIGNTTLSENIDYTLTYRDNINIGTAYVIVTGYGKYANTGTKSAYFRIVAPSVMNAVITSIPDQSYTGYAICPAVTAYINNIVLREGVDYTVSYYNNVNVGTATVTITGTGGYSGIRTTTFRITGPNLYNATIASIPDQLYTGSDIRPTVTVMMNNIALQQNIDYYVNYKNNRSIGTATVTVTGRGSYAGTKTATFRILGKDMANATVSSIGSQRYTGAEVCPGVTVKIGSYTLQKNVDYTLTYYNNIKPGTASITINSIGTYSGSKTVTFKIAQASLSSATVKVSNQTYDGEEKTPNVTVKLAGETLSEDEDYEVEYRNNTKPGKATVVIRGIGEYSDTVKGYFVIKPKKMTLVSAKATTNEKGKAVLLSWKKDSNVKGYELAYSKKKSSGYKRIGTVKMANTKAMHNRRSAGTYYYKIRSYIQVDGEKVYGAYSNAKKVRIK